MALFAALLLTAGWVFLIGRSALRRIPRLLRQNRGKKGDAALSALLIQEPFLRAWEKACEWDAFQHMLNSYHGKLMILNGASWTIERTKAEAASSVGTGYAALVGSCWLSWMIGENFILFAGVLAFVALAFRQFAEAGKKLERRKKAIITGLPDRMSKLMLLVSAGETVQRAFVRCMEGIDNLNHPLDKEWGAAVAAMNNGQSFSVVLERFNRSCAVQEASLFTTVMLLNYRKGGEHFVLAVRELSYSLWEKRKGLARISGEEASSKLVFPLVGVMFIMMIIVAAPALLVMS
ncbi:type II secretion system protein [Paenibacillus sp. 1011MAR3C5]|uniref:type II secretion system F family protein n=1 Tax=Paenibacillus sp. 1011MAR3C5 TaxID=1675787 RepID=UPI000E6C19EE|nr:type II secretion system F family protein [Paenibacillus sp. 1011MAR3C5]RJE91272.1 type II secretion system protein [Paenibacillus sp. 1011MAR3C5]